MLLRALKIKRTLRRKDPIKFYFLIGFYFLIPIRNKRVQEFLTKWLILGPEKEIYKMSMGLENKEILKNIKSV